MKVATKSVMISDEAHKKLRIYAAQKECMIMDVMEFAIDSVVDADLYETRKGSVVDI